MSAVDLSPRTQVALPPAIVGGIACALMLAWGVAAPRGVLQGWLIAFVAISGVSFGALALLCVRRLTGGRWGEAAAPTLILAGAATPLLALAWLPVLMGARLIFPWAEDAAATGAGVTRLYLNIGFFALRGFVALIGLSAFAALLIGGRRGRLAAGLGLVAYAVAVDFTAVDWMLSLEPRFSSSAFGATIAIQQILSAMALALLVSPIRSPGEASDLASLTLAATLGSLYMVTMSLIVNWYGDQPERAAWYLRRVADGWLWLAVATFAFGALIPIGALLFARVRRNVAPLRFVGASVLIAVVLRDLWLMAPVCDASAVPSAIVALVGIGGLSLAFAGWCRARLEPRRTSRA